MVTRVADLTVEELRLLIQETVAQALADLVRDPDQGLELRDEVRKELAAANAGGGPGAATRSASDVAVSLGLRW